jgi:hypothetical protein
MGIGESIMTDNEIRWYVTLKIGSKVNKNIIKNNKNVYSLLAKELNTNNVNDMLKFLYVIGFKFNNGKVGRPKPPEPVVKIYYTEPKKPNIKHITRAYDKNTLAFANL